MNGTMFALNQLKQEFNFEKEKKWTSTRSQKSIE